MNTSKIACYTKPDEAPVLTPAESIISMFEHTDENGVLYIPEWPVPLDDSAEDKELFYKCKMHCNAADLQDAADALRKRLSCAEAAFRKA